MTICLVDFSQAVISAVAAQAADVKDGDTKNLVKHIALNILLGLKKRFGHAKLILCCDSRHYWRKDEFPHYKGHRKHKRDDSFMDFELVFETLNELKVELAENFPYVVLELNGAEADDIIAVLSKYFYENELNFTGLIDEPHDVVICSTDGDFQQLQKMKHVQQWNNVTKHMMVCKSPTTYLQEHIASGDTGDNVPNVLTGDWWAKARADNESTRAKSMSEARLKEFSKRGYDACKTEEEQRNYRRNEKLVDLDMIPEKISTEIISQYINYEVKGNKKKIFDYLNSKRMKLLLASYGDF